MCYNSALREDVSKTGSGELYGEEDNGKWVTTWCYGARIYANMT